MSGEAIDRPGSTWWGSSALTVVLTAVYPTVFVVSQNWYALSGWQALWLVAASIIAGGVIFALAEGAFRLAGSVPLSGKEEEAPARAVALGLICAGILFFLLIATLKAAVPSTGTLVAIYFALATAFAGAFRRGAQRFLNSFLALLVAVASFTWMLGATSAPPQMIGSRLDFEAAKFGTKPNIYLFIYDAYGSEDVYKKIFKFDNSRHYRELESRGFKVLHTFSNYGSTWPTTLGTFLGQHHYYETATGNADSQAGRPIMAGLIHNPVLYTLRNNGYRLQYVHGIDFLVNEPGVVEFVYPQGTALSALRAFGNPTLSSIGGRKRRVTLDTQAAVLTERLQRPPEQTQSSWFTFAHVNIPAHGPSGPHWRQLGWFEQVFRDRTTQANKHMLQTIEAIKSKDPKAIIVIFGDHGAWRYGMIWGSGDPNEAFRSEGVPTEIVTLDRAGIMIAIHSAGLCDDYVYEGLTPINIMRVVFACLAGERNLMRAKAEDISLLPLNGNLWLLAKDGVALPRWEVFRRER